MCFKILKNTLKDGGLSIVKDCSNFFSSFIREIIREINFIIVILVHISVRVYVRENMQVALFFP